MEGLTTNNTKIQWCDDTLNPWWVCTEVSDGCGHCYAHTLARRFGHRWGKGAPRLLQEGAFRDAVRLNRKPWVCDACGKPPFAFLVNPEVCDDLGTPARRPACACGSTSFHRRQIFSLSMGDWLDPEVPIEWLARWLDTQRVNDQVVYLNLTKRPELAMQRLRDVLTWSWKKHDGSQGARSGFHLWLADWRERDIPPAHIKLGVSVENQEAADTRIPALLRIPASGYFLSCEPLLGPVDLALACPCEFGNGGGRCPRQAFGQVSIGGESGPKARPCNVEWIRSLVQQCRAAGVPAFVKQVGAKPIGRYNEAMKGWPEHNNPLNPIVPWKYRDPKGGDPSEWPEDLRARERPKWRS